MTDCNSIGTLSVLHWTSIRTSAIHSAVTVPMKNWNTGGVFACMFDGHGANCLQTRGFQEVKQNSLG